VPFTAALPFVLIFPIAAGEAASANGTQAINKDNSTARTALDPMGFLLEMIWDTIRLLM